MRQKGHLSRPTKLKEVLECSYLQNFIKEAVRLYLDNRLPLLMPRSIPVRGSNLGGMFFPCWCKSRLTSIATCLPTVANMRSEQTIVDINMWGPLLT